MREEPKDSSLKFVICVDPRSTDYFGPKYAMKPTTKVS
jgi:hypothetical protein